MNRAEHAAVFERGPEPGSLVTDTRIIAAGAAPAAAADQTPGDATGISPESNRADTSQSSKPIEAARQTVKGATGFTLGKQPVITYQQPADAKDVENAIAEAQQYSKAGERPPWSESLEEAERRKAARDRYATILWAGAGASALALLAAGIAVMRKRSETRRDG